MATVSTPRVSPSGEEAVVVVNESVFHVQNYLFSDTQALLQLSLARLPYSSHLVSFAARLECPWTGRELRGGLSLQERRTWRRGPVWPHVAVWEPVVARLVLHFTLSSLFLSHE